MKTKFTALCCSLLLATTAGLFAQDTAPKPKVGSPEFERMKTLVGTWTGQADMGQGPVTMTIEYRLVAAGSALQERIAPGTPHEMVTMYYDKAGKLAMTHYCVLGNRPEMALKSSDAKSLTFDLDSCCGIDPKKESTMSGTKIIFDDADTITTVCTGTMNGQETSAPQATFRRVKTAPAATR